MMRTYLLAAALAGLVATAPVMAQLDQADESAKSGELDSLKQVLAPRDDAEAVAELVAAEAALRRLHDAKTAGERRQIAVELDLALARLHLVADRAGH